MTTKKKAPAKAQEAKEETTDVAIVDEPSTEVAAFDYSDTGDGFEDITADDMSIPYILLLQANSEPCKKNGVEGAKEGMFFNTVTQELFSGEDGIVVVPVHIDHYYIERVPYDDGGEYIGRWEVNSFEVQAAIDENDGNKYGKLTGPSTEKNTELVETYDVYVLQLNEDGSQVESFGVIPFSSAKIAKFRKWISAMRMIKVNGRTPALFRNRARLSATDDISKAGQDFQNMNITALEGNWKTSLLPEDSDIFQEAVVFRNSVKDGTRRANVEAAVAADSGAEGSGGGDTPF